MRLRLLYMYIKVDQDISRALDAKIIALLMLKYHKHIVYRNFFSHHSRKSLSTHGQRGLKKWIILFDATD